MKTLIWEFYGFDAEETSRHHSFRIDEFMKREQFDSYEVSYRKIDENSAITLLKLENISKFEIIVKVLRPKKIEDN